MVHLLHVPIFLKKNWPPLALNRFVREKGLLVLAHLNDFAVSIQAQHQCILEQQSILEDLQKIRQSANRPRLNSEYHRYSVAVFEGVLSPMKFMDALMLR